MMRDAFPANVQLVTAQDLTVEELRFEIAVLAGLLADRTDSAEAARVLINVATAMTPGGRA